MCDYDDFYKEPQRYILKIGASYGLKTKDLNLLTKVLENVELVMQKGYDDHEDSWEDCSIPLSIVKPTPRT